MRGDVDTEELRFRPRVVGIVDVWLRGWDPILPGVRLALYTIPSQSAIGQWGWGLHTLRGSFDPGDHRFRPQVVGVVKAWNDL